MRCRKGLKPLKGRVSLETTRANPRKRSESEAIRGRKVRGTPKPGIVIKIGQSRNVGERLAERRKEK
jgi:hypothetical protein